MSQNTNPPGGYAGPERRQAFFPRRLRDVAREALLIDLPDGERRSGLDRRTGGEGRAAIPER
jgi:hypothetical protein